MTVWSRYRVEPVTPRSLFAFALLVVLLAPVAVFAKTDVVVMINGDRLTGEVKGLERGRLSFKTDATGTIGIEWDDVAYLSSDQNLQIELQDGQRYLGHLINSDQQASLQLRSAEGIVTLPILDVVLVTPIESTVIDRLDGEISAGFSHTRASEVTQFNLGLKGDYRTEQRAITFGLDSVIVDSDKTSQRQNLDLRYIRFRPARWFTGALFALESNDELGLDLRTSVGGGGGRYLHQTNSSKFSFLSALMLSNEETDAGTKRSLEGIAALKLEWYRYDTPELDVSTTLQVIPNLSDTGRLRSNLDLAITWEIVEDLFWRLTFYDSYDSDPSSADAQTNDFGVISSFGWEF